MRLSLLRIILKINECYGKIYFLQHGIIHNDQSTLFRPDWKKIDIF